MGTDPEKIKSIPFFFIIGQPRSGTTLLRTLFDAHSNVTIPVESPFIINLSFKYSKKKYWSRKNLISFYNSLIKQRWFDLWTIDTAKLRNDLLSCEGDYTYETICKLVNSHYQSCFEKKEILLIGDKNPLYSYYPKRLIRLFPEAKFIHIVRNPKDNILSCLKVNFEMPLKIFLAYRWKYFVKKITVVKEKHPQQFFTIKYEDLVSNPEISMQKISAFLCIDHEPETLNFYKKAENIFSKYPDEAVSRNFKSLLEPINNNKTGIWQSEMQKNDIRIIDHVTKNYAGLYEYELSNEKIRFRQYFQLIPAFFLANILFMARKFIDILPFNFRNLLVNKDLIFASLLRKEE